jgi:catalase (peroxidase I)
MVNQRTVPVIAALRRVLEAFNAKKTGVVRASLADLIVLGDHDGSAHGIFTDRVGVLTIDFFTVLTSMEYEWKKEDEAGLLFSLHDRASAEPRFKATRSDLIFGSQQPASCRCRGLCEQRWARSVRQRLREGLEQGHDARSF